MDKNKGRNSISGSHKRLPPWHGGKGIQNSKVLSEKDPSRPDLKRETCEIGIYIDVCEFTPAETVFGSPQYNRLTVSDRMLEYLASLDVMLVKNKLQKRGIFKGCVLEHFLPGLILVVGFNTVMALDDVVRLYYDKSLTDHLQTVLLTEELLNFTNTTAITLNVRLWEDEFRPCREELITLDTSNVVVPLKSKPTRIKMLTRIRKYQKTLVAQILELRDLVTLIENDLSNLIFALKSYIPLRQNKIHTLKEVEDLANHAISKRSEHEKVVATYLLVLKKGRDLIEQIQCNIADGLDSVYTQCEKIKQREIKSKILKMQEKIVQILNDEKFPIQQLRDNDWSYRIPTSVHGLFLGALSVLPILVDSIVDIDALTDEYISGFPDTIPT